MSRLITEVNVGINFGMQTQPVGRLAIRNNIIYFEYSEEFRQRGIEISPVRLPLRQGVIELPLRPFEGLAGVFNDSLPDGWGRLLLDRAMRSQGIAPSNLSSLDRLAHVGFYGMGALVYEPDHSPQEIAQLIDLDHLAKQTEEVLEGSSELVIENLLALNGSSAGARPKALIGVDANRINIRFGARELDEKFEPWLVKFPNSMDGYDAGAIEYIYALMAKEAGVLMPDIHLFPSKKGAGYFAVKRFDRNGIKRLHMHTAGGLLHSDFRMPALDYEDLMNLTVALTKDVREVEKLYRLAVFNTLSHNRDDHAKNFSYLMDESGDWKLAPAYDLTYSNGPNGEQSTMVMGEGKQPTAEHLIKLGLQAKISKKLILEIVDQTKNALGKWKHLSKEYGIKKTHIELIGKSINL
jgi:serine/threonine-protein kinase HipA